MVKYRDRNGTADYRHLPDIDQFFYRTRIRLDFCHSSFYSGGHLSHGAAQQELRPHIGKVFWKVAT